MNNHRPSWLTNRTRTSSNILSEKDAAYDTSTSMAPNPAIAGPSDYAVAPVQPQIVLLYMAAGILVLACGFFLGYVCVIVYWNFRCGRTKIPHPATTAFGRHCLSKFNNIWRRCGRRPRRSSVEARSDELVSSRFCDDYIYLLN